MKHAVRTLLTNANLDVQEFGAAGLSKDLVWNADSSLEVMRQCEGAVVLAFARFTMQDESGQTWRIPTEYNHFEGALALALGLPTLVIADEGIPTRGITHPALGVPLLTIPSEASSLWPFDDPAFLSLYQKWLDAVKRKQAFHSCFISYSAKDEAFCQRLYSRLQRAGMKVWFAPHHIHAGQKIHEQLKQAIGEHDKLLLVLTQKSMESEWVGHEIRSARKRELHEKRRVLFPIRLVSYEALGAWEYFDADSKKDLAAEIREYYIPDFTNWEDPNEFESVFGKLLADLQVSSETP